MSTEQYPTGRDTSITHLDPSLEVTALAITAEELEPADPDARKGGLGAGAWLSLGWIVGLATLSVIAPFLPFPDPSESVAALARQGPVVNQWLIALLALVVLGVVSVLLTSMVRRSDDSGVRVRTIRVVIGVIAAVIVIATLAVHVSRNQGSLLGGDTIGRDMLSRIIYGTRSSFAIGFGAVGFGLIIGGFLGLVTGFFRGRVDGVITPAMTILLAIPQFVLALALVTVLASSDDTSSSKRIGVVILGLGIVSIPILGRITRANTLVWSEREFVLASKAMGAKSWRTMFREVLPNVVPAMMSIALLGVGIAIVAEGGLSLFGVGVQLPTPSWGNIIAENRDQLRRSPHMVMITIIVLFITVLALNYLADVVAKRFEVRESVL
ncbi:MAG: ABC transporter permease [Actinobacteria bacterium]|nr:ABC transporter permease [Actinomycetota bacterium]